MLTPKASKTSAAPDLLDAARFPCFATGTPPAAMTKEDVVEILNELD